ncbi:MAG TPA: hypothetical protein DCR35_14405, partial [Runella sp.]|nr:hypothetical protein [Runella sp.]
MYKPLLLSFLVCGITGFVQKANAQVFAANYTTISQQNKNQPDRKASIPLKEALRDAETRFGIHLVYKTDEIPNRLIAADALSGKLEQVLENLLNPAGLTYKKVRNTYIIKTQKVKTSGKEILTPSETSPEALPSTRTISNDLSSLRTVPSQLQFPTSAARAVVLEDIKIAGKVGEENGQGLPGVSILLKGTNRGTTTDANGAFQLAVPDEKAVLVF